VVDWSRFTPSSFEYNDASDKLAHHAISLEEATQCFFNGFEVRRNRRFRDRYQLLGQTDGGRRLKVIFQLKPRSVVRIITGWDL